MSNFWRDLPKPFFVLAPMEAVTDVVFRHVIRQAGRPDVYFTEFTNATGWFRAGDKAIGGRLVKTDDESLIIAQLWGSDPEAMAALSKHCADLGYDGIDINMGCPDQSAIKGGGGADMIRHPERAGAIIAAAKESGLPVSVKTRLGYTYVDEWRDWLAFLLQQDIAALTIHLRTKKEMSKVPAHFELIDDIKALRDEISPETPLIINGDILDRTHGENLAATHGIDGIMIGRGVFANPFCFSTSPPISSSRFASNSLASADESSSSSEALTRSPDVSPETCADDEWAANKRHGDSATEYESHKQQLIELLRFHLDQFDHYQPQMGRPFETLKRFFKIYIRDFDGASSLRAALMLAHNTTEVRYLLDNHEKATQPLEKKLNGKYNLPMSNTIKAIVFDSDGTLLDTRQLILQGYKTVLKHHNLEHLATDQYISKRLGKPVPETYEQIIAGHHVAATVDQLAEEHDTVQNSLAHLIEPYAGTVELLNHWKKSGIKLCLFTSGKRMMIERNFAAAGIENVDEIFDSIVTADDDLARKPEPDAILHLLNDIDIAPENAVVVGDHPYDIISARRVGIGLKIGILHGFGTSRELLQSGADFLCDNLDSLNNLMRFSLK